jgi:hypothetical protein
MMESPFVTGAPALTALGYTTIPIAAADCELPARGKVPARFVSGSWYPMKKWEAFRDRNPSPFELKGWQTWPGANVGLIMGTAIRPGYVVGAIDIDATDPDELDAIMRACPASPMVKRAAKGETRFYAMPESIKSTPYVVRWIEDGKKKQRTLVDLLTGNQTRQTVCPPSMHPDGMPYTWLAGPVSVKDLPTFDQDDLDVLTETLETLGWGREVEGLAPVKSEARPQHSDFDPTAHSDLNALALTRMADWVPALDLYDLRQKQGGGYEAVATWRESNTGRALADRKRNLQMHSTGIRDFGDRSYSALDLVQAARSVSLNDAFMWLSERLGTLEPLPILNQREDGSIEIEGRVVAPVDDGDHELPDVLTRVPGLVGDIVDYIEAASQFPQRGLALGVALGIVGTAAGRKFAGPTRSGTHLYIFALAPTGAGKAFAPKMARRILQKANLGHLIGATNFMSGSALMGQMADKPAAISFMDEFGVFMAKINAKTASAHDRMLSGLMREYWGSSFDTVYPAAWAHSNAAANTKPIHAPALSVYGMSVHEEFYEALQGADVFNGFLNRFLIISTRREPCEQEPTTDEDEIPESITSRLSEIYLHGGAVYSTSMHSDEASKPLVRLPWGPGGQEIYRAFKAKTDHDVVNGKMLKRTAEIALRLATIRAIGHSGASAEISAEDMQWGVDIAWWSACRMIADAEAYMVESENQRIVKTVWRTIAAEPLGLDHSSLLRKLKHKWPKRVITEAIESLSGAGQIMVAQKKTAGRPANVYVAEAGA